MTIRSMLAAAAALALVSGGGAYAQTAPQPAAAPVPVAIDVPDPARMAVARDIAVRLFPLGSYKKMLGESYDKMMDGMMDSAMQMPMNEIARLGGLDEGAVAKMSPAKLSEVMAIYDPSWRERMRISMSMMTVSMGDIMAKFEPRMQEAMARAYARDFTMPQLTELRAFLVTPTGALYADRSLAIFMDREVTKEMQALMPEIMAQMPTMMEKMKEAEAKLPPRRKIEDLSDADRKRLADLMGVKVENLDDPDRIPLQ
jgi:hypothetical protein